MSEFPPTTGKTYFLYIYINLVSLIQSLMHYKQDGKRLENNLQT